MVHLFLHVAVPALITALFFRRQWKLAFPLLMAGMLVDVDHLLADPIYDPTRCSIGFHPLHKPVFILSYGVLALLPKTRILGLGLITHMVLDSIDCQLTNGVWINP